MPAYPQPRRSIDPVATAGLLTACLLLVVVALGPVFVVFGGPTGRTVALALAGLAFVLDKGERYLARRCRLDHPGDRPED